MNFKGYLNENLNDDKSKDYYNSLARINKFLSNNEFEHGGARLEIFKQLLIEGNNWNYNEKERKIYNYRDYLKKNYSFIFKFFKSDNIDIEKLSLNELREIKNLMSKRGNVLFFAISQSFGGGVPSAMTEYLIKFKSQNKNNFLKGEDKVQNKMQNKINKPHNRIIYGAPGTGKSYKLNKEVKAFKRKFVELIEDDEKSIPTYWLGTCGENNYMFEEFKDKDIFAIGWDALGDPRRFDSIEILNSELIKIYPSISENNKTFNYFSYIKTMKKGDIILIRKGISLEIQGYGEVVEEYDYKPDLIKSYPNTVKVNWKKTSPQILEGYSGKQLTRNTLIPSPTEVISILNEKQYFEEKIKTKEKTISTINRVTFYDGYTHGQFVGTYKPVPEGDSITYKYIPGPFMKQLVESYKNPTNNFCLIIEEINRAKADKVFGNIFQLLDRDSDGNSEYHIAVSADQKTYLRRELENEYDETLKDLLDKGLYIPKNLYIWATMNSADQGVYPMDSAFKRRWHFEHIGLDENENKFGDKDKTYELTYQQESETEGAEKKTILWNEFRKIINENLLRDNVSEDRLLAPFFIKENNFKLKENNIYELNEGVFKNKILMYLFDDVLRHKRKNILFDENIKSFSQLIKACEDGKVIFSKEIIEKLDIKKIIKEVIAKIVSKED